MKLACIAIGAVLLSGCATFDPVVVTPAEEDRAVETKVQHHGLNYSVNGVWGDYKNPRMITGRLYFGDSNTWGGPIEGGAGARKKKITIGVSPLKNVTVFTGITLLEADGNPGVNVGPVGVELDGNKRVISYTFFAQTIGNAHVKQVDAHYIIFGEE